MTNVMNDRLRDILAGKDKDPLPALRELGLLPPAEGIESRTIETFGDAVLAPIVHLDPRTPYKKDGTTGVSAIYLADAYMSSMATTPYFSLPSSPEDSPYLIIYFTGRPANKAFTATLDMQVYSTGGSVRITATNNPFATIVTHSGTGGGRVHVPVTLTTTATGFSSVLLQRIGETGFDWFGVDLT